MLRDLHFSGACFVTCGSESQPQTAAARSHMQACMLLSGGSYSQLPTLGGTCWPVSCDRLYCLGDGAMRAWHHESFLWLKVLPSQLSLAYMGNSLGAASHLFAGLVQSFSAQAAGCLPLTDLAHSCKHEDTFLNGTLCSRVA